MAGLSLSVTLGPQWRDALGRFARRPVQGAIDSGMYSLSQSVLPRLIQATPIGVRPKEEAQRMRNSWHADYAPSQQALKITNTRPYWTFVALTGTDRMQPNAALQRVIVDELPQEAQVTTDAIGRAIVVALKG